MGRTSGGSGGGGAVSSVFTRTGAVIAATNDYTVAQVTGAAPSNSPTLVTPALGTPASGDLANCTGYPVSGNPGTLLAQKVYPATGTGTYTTTSTSFAAIDATNLTVTFTAPSSGDVWIDMSAIFTIPANDSITISVMNGASQIGGTCEVNGGTLSILLYLLARFLVTGLTPGDSYTLALAWKVSGSTGTIYYGASYPICVKVEAAL